MNKSLISAALLAITLPALAQTTTPLTRAEVSISPDRIREHDKFLSDDLLEGRYPGLRGGELAAKYIATQFALAGLQPAGDNGTYLQQVNFVGMKAVPAETKFELVPAKGKAMMLTFGKDFTVSNQTLTDVTKLDAPIVFVGFGATAPEYNWDDYAGVDVKGKIILCIVGDPPSDNPKFFMGKALTYYGRWTYKFEQAARKGAIGALVIHRTDYASYGWDVVEHSNSGERTFLRDDANPRLQAASWIHLEAARKLFAMSGLDLDKEMEAASKRGFKAVELPVRLKATVTSTVRPFQSPNVVGILRGKNDVRPDPCVAPIIPHEPACKGCCQPQPVPDQAVLYTAHYDHLGFVPGMPGDNIYNGAADNGTGSAMIIELARAWSQLAKETKLPHSVIIAAVTAEEQGLLGSEYLGQHPPVPSSQIALDINYDEILPIGVPKEVTVAGAERTTFYPAVEATAKKFHITIVPDAHPESGGYYRSDHFSLSRVGIPAFSVDQGSLIAGHDRAYGEAKLKDYDNHHYHDFSDNFDPTWDFAGNAHLLRFGMDLGWQVIHLPHTIEWKHGDEFEPARLAAEKK